jgi:glutamate-5-semialdehyde dehydrogenase
MKEAAKICKDASRKLAALGTEQKDKALQFIKDILKSHSNEIISANNQDMQRSEKENLAAPLLKRLKFDSSKIDQVCLGIDSLKDLKDPVGKVLQATELDQGLELYKVACPIGVIGMIFESRPDALVQIATLCLKSGNGVILKGGSEAMETNKILVELIAQATEKAGIPTGWIQLAQSREEVREMLALDEYIDLIIPRGSNEFVKFIMDNSSIPVLGHADGICHLYVDEKADLDMAINVTVDSKTQYVAVCNALETLLVHSKVAEALLPRLKTALEAKNTELRGCSRTCDIIQIKAASDQDWATEYLDYILSIKIVDSMDEAIDHIHRYGSGHTESIITADSVTAENFMNRVDSGDLFWNCSTRFSDGFRYGLGAEVGISTNRIHARGPVGMEGLMIYKWKLYGKGQIVEDYSSGKKSFTHRSMGV